MNNHIFPVIGHLPVAELKPRHFIDLLKGIEQKGLLEVAARTRQHMCNIMRHAVHQELIEHNPAANLEGIIAPPVKRHYPALQLERLPELLARIEDYQQGRELTRLAVLLTLHLFIRSSELRFARWSEIDFKIESGPFLPLASPSPASATLAVVQNAHSTYRSTLLPVYCYSETDTGNIRTSGVGIPRRS